MMIRLDLCVIFSDLHSVFCLQMAKAMIGARTIRPTPRMVRAISVFSKFITIPRILMINDRRIYMGGT